MDRSPHVDVAGFPVADLASARLVEVIVEQALRQAGDRPTPVYALHVGGLNVRHDPAFREAMLGADLVYADGMSIVALARLAGAEDIERAGTTDIGWDVVTALGRALDRPPRIALLGGPPGLAERAGAALTEGTGAEIVFTEHGYHDDWTGPITSAAASGCDLLLVGLGAPLEMKWTHHHLDALPSCLVLTCGGWFGFLAADEQRAPDWMQRVGLEWVYRVRQAPGRLAGRYARGAGVSLVVAGGILRRRVAARRD